MTVIAVINLTIFVIRSGRSSNLVLRSASNTLSVVFLNTRLAADMTTTIRELSDLVSAVQIVSSSRCGVCISNSLGFVISDFRLRRSQDSSALSNVFRSTFKNTSSVFRSTW